MKTRQTGLVLTLTIGTDMTEHLPDTNTFFFITSYKTGYQRGLDDVREKVAETHLPIPVIQCACGWGVNCDVCGPESNRIVGHVCRVCCDDWDGHGYCSDMHNEDDTPLHHVGEEMWSGPFCPVIATIDALRKRP
jgi:hypothetical protein